ncbi:MAG: YiiD C-terminal domain-containing protein [Proteobacteria bacterium]|nr:YiiD C-terminal domain-containing protein [Pseudomonadota bacterium]
MSVDAAAMGANLERIPFTLEMGLVIERLQDGETHMLLPAGRGNHNLVGTVHAGAVFTFAETVAGVAAGADTLEHGFPFVRSARVRYLRPGDGELHGHASVEAEDVARVLAELSEYGRSRLSVSVKIEDTEGRLVAELDVDYAFRPIAGEKK